MNRHHGIDISTSIMIRAEGLLRDKYTSLVVMAALSTILTWAARQNRPFVCFGPLEDTTFRSHEYLLLVSNFYPCE